LKISSKLIIYIEKNLKKYFFVSKLLLGDKKNHIGVEMSSFFAEKTKNL
jgi:hypothetical protein